MVFDGSHELEVHFLKHPNGHPWRSLDSGINQFPSLVVTDLMYNQLHQ